MRAILVSLRSDIQGSHGALVDERGKVLATARAWHPLPRPCAGFLGVDAMAISHAFIDVCRTLGERLEPADRGRIAAIGVTTSRDTALLVGSENAHLTPVLFGRGTPLPGSDVPAGIRDSPGHAALYRRSVVRVVREHVREVALAEVVRVVSLGAYLHNLLTGHWVDNAACSPSTLPRRGGVLGGDELAWEAVGHPSHRVSLHVPSGGLAAQLAPQVARSLGWPNATPLVSTGDIEGCAAQALAADAAGWAVALDDGLGATFLAPRASRHGGYTIQVVDRDERGDDGERDHDESLTLAPGQSEAGFGGDDDGPLALEPAQAAWVIQERLGARVDARPGPVADLWSYRVSTPRGFHESFGAGTVGRLTDAVSVATPGPRALVSLPALRRVPVGAHGLRVVFGAESAVVVGARPGQDQATVWRAVLEGLALELGRWRLAAGVLGTSVPRFVVRRPWTFGVGALVADVIGESVVLWGGEPELVALIGQARAMAMTMGIDTDEWEPLPLRVEEPGEGAQGYRAARTLHLTLCDALAPML